MTPLDSELITAAQNGHTDVVRCLLDRGADVNAKDAYGNTALMWAGHHGHKEVFKLLWDRGADRSIGWTDPKTNIASCSQCGYTGWIMCPSGCIGGSHRRRLPISGVFDYVIEKCGGCSGKGILPCPNCEKGRSRGR